MAATMGEENEVPPAPDQPLGAPVQACASVGCIRPAKDVVVTPDAVGCEERDVGNVADPVFGDADEPDCHEGLA